MKARDYEPSQEERCAGREFAQTVADAMEEAQKLKENAPFGWLGFNMLDWKSYSYTDHSERSCGTTACLAGWAHAVKHGNVEFRKPLDRPGGASYYHWQVGADENSSVAEAMRAFGLNHNEAVELFDPQEAKSTLGRNPTDKDAIKVLRHYGNTGIANWKAAL